jgi:hypothetical protein
MGYIARANDIWRIWGTGPSVGIGHSPESVFRNGTDLELTRAWSVVGGYEHRWTEQWSTSIFGGYNKADFSARAEDMICSRGEFAGTARPFSGFTVTNCSPDFAFWNIGTRVKWMPHPLLEISTSVQMYRLETAHAGAGVVTANDGARPAGPVTFEDQDVFLFHLRLEYEIVP